MSLTGVTVLSLSKTHLSLLSTGSTQEDPSQHNCKCVDWDIIKSNKMVYRFVFLFDSMMVGQALDSMVTLTKNCR